MRISIWISGEHYGSTICFNRQSRIVTRFIVLLLVYASTLLIDDYSVNAKRIMKALATSTKNAATNDRMINAADPGPCTLVTVRAKYRIYRECPGSLAGLRNPNRIFRTPFGNRIAVTHYQFIVQPVNFRCLAIKIKSFNSILIINGL